MRAKAARLLVASLAGVAVLTGGVASALAIANKGGATCKYMLTNSGNSGSEHGGTESGTVSCPKPAGTGTARASYKTKLEAEAFIDKGKFKDTFKSGTIRGSYRIIGPFDGVTYTATGHFKIKRGTGKLSKATGSGKMSCSTKDSGATYRCTMVLTKGKL